MRDAVFGQAAHDRTADKSAAADDDDALGLFRLRVRVLQHRTVPRFRPAPGQANSVATRPLVPPPDRAQRKDRAPRARAYRPRSRRAGWRGIAATASGSSA